MRSEELFPEALKLSARERAELAHALLQSLHGEPQSERDIGQTLARRAREVAEGSAEVVDAQVALDEISVRLKQRREG